MTLPDGGTWTYGYARNCTYDGDCTPTFAAEFLGGTASTSYGYDAANRLASVSVLPSAPNVASDADGNTLSDGKRTNAWDSQNRLASCTSGGTTSTYTYGSDGLRRSSTVTPADGSSTATCYAYGVSFRYEAYDPGQHIGQIALAKRQTSSPGGA